MRRQPGCNHRGVEAMKEGSSPRFPEPDPTFGPRSPDPRLCPPGGRERSGKNTGPAGNQSCRDPSQAESRGADDALTVSAGLARWSDLWSEGTGAIDGPVSSGPSPETIDELAPRTPAADRR